MYFKTLAGTVGLATNHYQLNKPIRENVMRPKIKMNGRMFEKFKRELRRQGKSFTQMRAGSDNHASIAVIGDWQEKEFITLPSKDSSGNYMIYDPVISAELGMATYKPVSG